MLNSHIKNKNILTVGTRTYKTQIPYGIINQENDKIYSIEEKPTLEYIINAGIYALSPEAISHIPFKTCFHMTTLIEKLNSLKLKVGSFLIKDYWLDIGTINDYYKANLEFNEYFC